MAQNYSVLTQNRFEYLQSDDDSDQIKTKSLSKQTEIAKPWEIPKRGEVQKRAEAQKRAPLKPTKPMWQRTDAPPMEPMKAGDDSNEDTVVTKPHLRPPIHRDHRPTNGTLRGNQRLYDRRSGTGRGKEMKRHGAGSHNWGVEIDPEFIDKDPTDSDTFKPKTDLGGKRYKTKKPSSAEEGSSETPFDTEESALESGDGPKETRTTYPDKYPKRFSGRGRGMPRQPRKGPRQFRTRREASQSPPKEPEVHIPVMLDLTDSSAFPMLS